MDKQERRKISAQYKERRQVGGVYAIRCTQTGKRVLLSTMDMPGSENRFRFAQSTGGCVHPKLSRDWDAYGGKAFAFETLETLEQKENQTDAAFRQEIKELLEMLISEAGSETLY